MNIRGFLSIKSVTAVTLFSFSALFAGYYINTPFQLKRWKIGRFIDSRGDPAIEYCKDIGATLDKLGATLYNIEGRPLRK